MAVESGRPNEFADDAHFWPEDPVKDSIFWKAGPEKTNEWQLQVLQINICYT